MEEILGFLYDDRMRCLVIANAADADSGFVGHRLRHHGYALTEAHREHPDQWPDLAGIDLLLLLGSEWSVYWDAVAPSVEAEVAIVRAAARAEVPILGVCFGAQMIAHAWGGSVSRADRPEIGWHRIESSLPDVVADGPWLQWHYDVFTVPKDFERMASSPVGPQVVRHGRILATQFHPEATETILARWSAGGGAEELVRIGSSVEELMEESRRQLSASEPRCNRLVDWFVHEVAPS